MMVDLAQHYDEGPVHMGDIAERQGISAKYLEQLIIPLKKSNFIKSVRGPKGGHMLARPPEEISVGEIVGVLEGGIDLADCIEKPQECNRSSKCVTRGIWEEATKVMYDKLNSITLYQLVEEEVL
jgi:Rrf2 family protein